jgi:hypothetical protein
MYLPRTLIALLFVLVFMLSACSNAKTLNFSGESDQWSADLKVTQTKDDYEKQEFKLSYKGEDLNSVGEFSYNVETNAGGFGSSGVKLDDNGILKAIDQGNPTNAKVIEESEVEVIVEWNDNSEVIKLDLEN